MGQQLNLTPDEKSFLDATYIAEKLTNNCCELTKSCITKLNGKKIVFNTNNADVQPIGGWPSKDSSIVVKEFSRFQMPILIASIDSSCIPIADAEDGYVYVARVAVAFFYDGRPLNYIRIGPLIFHLNEQNTCRLLSDQPECNRLSKLVLLDKAIAQRMIRIRLERLIARELSCNLSGGIILIDGSLKNSIFDPSNSSLSDILKIARKEKNRIVGISKSSKLRFLNSPLRELHCINKAPVYSDIHYLVSPFLQGLVGRVLLVKFTQDGFVFRVDVADFESCHEETLSLLRNNDTFFRGYPESLRIAHHLSIFSNSDCISIKSYLTKKAGAIELPSECSRKVILGSLGRLSK